MKLPLAGFFWPVAALCLCSCNASDRNYFPITKASVWKYAVQGDFDTFPDTVIVTGRVPVSDVEGFELAGAMGVSRLGWRGGNLVASELGGQRFDPPITILSQSPVSWAGTWETAGKPRQAKADLTTSTTQTTVAGKKTKALESVLTFHAGGKTTTLTTVFVQGIGIFSQEQRSGDRRERRIDYLSGP